MWYVNEKYCKLYNVLVRMSQSCSWLNILHLEQQSSHASHLTLFFDKDLKVLVDDSDSK